MRRYDALARHERAQHADSQIKVFNLGIVSTIWYPPGCGKSTKKKGGIWERMYLLGLSFPRERAIIGDDNEIRCLQGGVKVPTGGTVRERLSERVRQLTRRNSGTDSNSLDGRRRAGTLV